MHRGYIKLWRKVEDSFLMLDSEAFHLWFVLLMLANHQDKEHLFNAQKVIIKRGQLISGRHSLSDRTSINESKVYRLLELFEHEQLIEQQKNNRYSIISILNYNEYQSNEQQNEQPVNNQRTTSEQPVNTPKELISIKNNDKKDIPPRFTDTNLNHTFKQFLEMRKLIKKPLTTHGEELIIKRLNKENVETAIGMLNQSIERSWAGIFPLKEGFNNVTTKRMLS